MLHSQREQCCLSDQMLVDAFVVTLSLDELTLYERNEMHGLINFGVQCIS
jgi:hypothetical protein